MNHPVIEARDLHAYYDMSHVLRGMSLTVGRGEIVALMGRNGMGKTTTLRVLLGLLKPRKGSVFVHGRDMTSATPHLVARQGIAFVPEGRGIFFDLTVRENLIMAARPSCDGGTQWTLDRVLGLFPRLAERLRNMGGQLSGGEQQMLAIGRALMTNPLLLVLDEATEGLAPLIRCDIWAALRQLKSTGMAALIVDKDVEALSDLADHCVVIAKGEVVYAGASAALTSDRDSIVRHLAI